MQTLLLTSSIDATSDLFVRAAREEVFRLNSDILEQYELEMDSDGFCARDPVGRSIDHSRVTAVYWRKPLGGLAVLPEDGVDVSHEKGQRRHIFFDLAGLCSDAGKWMLVDPFADARVTRARQLQAAKRYFAIPRWRIQCGQAHSPVAPTVVKPLTAGTFPDGSVLPVSRVPPGASLSAHYSWYIQETVEAAFDATVVFCCGRLFAFQLDRSLLDGEVDWRLVGHVTESAGAWHATPIPHGVSRSIVQFMSDLALQYGRLDFLVDRTGSWWFLEVNPNGQYAWLDLDGALGLLPWVFSCAESPPA
jgi:hypothetical protein